MIFFPLFFLLFCWRREFKCPDVLRRVAACRLKTSLLILGHLMKRRLLRGNWISRVASPHRSRQLGFQLSLGGASEEMICLAVLLQTVYPSISSQATDTERVYFGLFTSVHPANYITAQCGKEEVMSQVLGGKTLFDFSQTALTNHSFFFYSTSLS